MIVNWPILAEHYDDAAGYMPEWKAAHESMARLCRYIDASPMKSGLHGHTSMHQLRIAQVEYEFPPDPTIPWLTIEPKANDQIEFCYLDTNIEERQWRRITAPANVLDRFRNTVRQLGWSAVELP